MILYPTETVYALGINPLDFKELTLLHTLKGHPVDKNVSWLVRDIADIQHFAVLSDTAVKIAERFLPGPLTIVLPLKDEVILKYNLDRRTAGFRVSSDPRTQKLIHDFMNEHSTPLTCTSANISGMPTCATPQEILAQFGERAHIIDTIIDGGKREGVASTVVSVIGDVVTIIREGAISSGDILGM